MIINIIKNNHYSHKNATVFSKIAEQCKPFSNGYEDVKKLFSIFDVITEITKSN